MAELVYLLCAVTSTVCAWLLFRGYRATRTRLLFWSCLSFGGLALNNILLVVDLVVFPGPEMDLSLLRTGTALASLVVLIVGLAWEPT